MNEQPAAAAAAAAGTTSGATSNQAAPAAANPFNKTYARRFEQGSHEILCRVIRSPCKVGNPVFETKLSESADNEQELQAMMCAKLKAQSAKHAQFPVLYLNGWRHSQQHPGAVEILLDAPFSDSKQQTVLVDQDKKDLVLSVGPWGAKKVDGRLYAFTPSSEASHCWMHDLITPDNQAVGKFRDQNSLNLTFKNIEWTYTLYSHDPAKTLTGTELRRQSAENPDAVPGLIWHEDTKTYGLRCHSEGEGPKKKRRTLSFRVATNPKRISKRTYTTQLAAYEAAKAFQEKVFDEIKEQSKQIQRPRLTIPSEVEDAIRKQCAPKTAAPRPGYTLNPNLDVSNGDTGGWLVGDIQQYTKDTFCYKFSPAFEDCRHYNTKKEAVEAMIYHNRAGNRSVNQWTQEEADDGVGIMRLDGEEPTDRTMIFDRPMAKWLMPHRWTCGQTPLQALNADGGSQWRNAADVVAYHTLDKTKFASTKAEYRKNFLIRGSEPSDGGVDVRATNIKVYELRQTGELIEEQDGIQLTRDPGWPAWQWYSFNVATTDAMSASWMTRFDAEGGPHLKAEARGRAVAAMAQADRWQAWMLSEAKNQRPLSEEGRLMFHPGTEAKAKKRKHPEERSE